MADNEITVEAYRAGGSFPAGTVILDSAEAIHGMSDEELKGLDDHGIVRIDSTDNSLSLSFARIKALESVAFTTEDKITLSDTQEIIEDLGGIVLAELAEKGVDVINSLDDKLDLGFARGVLQIDLSFSEEDFVTIADSIKVDQKFTPQDIELLSNKGIDVVYVDPFKTGYNIDLVMAKAVADSKLSYAADDMVNIVDLGSNVQSLTHIQISNLAHKGVDSIDALDDALTLDFKQFNALDSIQLTVDDAITLQISSSELAGVSVNEVAAFSTKGIDVIDARENALALTLEQFNALGGTKLTVSDFISLSTTGAKLGALTAAQITSLAAAGIDLIDASDNKLALSLDQYKALSTIKLLSSDAVTLSDTGAKLTALTEAQISMFATAGIDELDASNNSYTLSSAQYNALGPIKLSDTDVVTIAADGNVTLSNGGSNLILTGNAIRGTGNNLANIVSGNAKSNILAGLEGNDFLYGGLGKDQLSGGAGRDVFAFDTKANKSTNVDTIVDFKSKDDSIYLDNTFFTKLGKGAPTKPVKFKSDMFVESAKAKDKEDRIVYDKKTGSLYYDADGTGKGTQVKIATMANKEKLFFHDFFVI